LNSTFEGLRRVDRPDYPKYALRESLVNAIVHRDYDYSGSVIINAFNNRITSPPG
jgi:ATP-dependent DNA helicase RecG